MLKKIDQADIDQLDDAQRQNLMVNAEGEYVFAQADEKAWRKHLEQVKASEAAQKKQQVGDKELQDRGLECSIDRRLFVDPMKTPCCGKTYCHNCIENALLENDLTCPGCETENISLERLEPDEEMKTKIKEYEAEKASATQRSRSPTLAADSPEDKASPVSRPGSRDGTGTPQSATGSAKKRSASEIDGATVSGNLAAPAMKRQKSGDAASTPRAEGGATVKRDGSKEASTSTPEVSNALPANIMPPDFSQMQQANSMNMPMMPGFNPFMMNPMMMGMGNGMSPMNGMNFMNPMMNAMNPGNMNMGMNFQAQNQMPNWNASMNMNTNMNQNQNQNQNMHKNVNQSQPNNYNKFNNRAPRNPSFQPQQQSKPSTPQQPPGLKGVPTGPKALQSQPQNNFNQTQTQQGFYPPTGPAGNKFSNQQRHLGNEEDNAYMRQPVNPHRHNNRNRRPRQADYREL